MKKFLSTNKGTLLIYSIIVFSVALISLFLLFAGIYEVSAILGISGVCTFFFLMIMLYGNLKRDENTNIKPGTFLLFSFLRVLLLALSVGLSFILLFFTNEAENKFRFLYVLISVIPLLISIILFSLKGKNE